MHLKCMKNESNICSGNPCQVTYCFQSPTVYRSASSKPQNTWDCFNICNQMQWIGNSEVRYLLVLLLLSKVSKEPSFAFFSGHEFQQHKAQEWGVPGPPRPGTHVTSMLSCSVFLNVFLPSSRIRILETQRIISILECSAVRYRLYINPNLSPPLGLQSDRSFPGKFGILAKAEQPKSCLLLRMKQNLDSWQVSHHKTIKDLGQCLVYNMGYFVYSKHL